MRVSRGSWCAVFVCLLLVIARVPVIAPPELMRECQLAFSHQLSYALEYQARQSRSASSAITSDRRLAVSLNRCLRSDACYVLALCGCAWRAEAMGVVAVVLLAGLPSAAREREHLLVLPAAARLLLVAHVHRPVRRGTQGVAFCALEPPLVPLLP